MIRMSFVVTAEFILWMLPNFQIPRTLHLFLASGADTYYGLAQESSSMGEEAAFRWERGQEQNVSGSGWSGKNLVTRGEGMRNLS